MLKGGKKHHRCLQNLPLSPYPDQSSCITGILRIFEWIPTCFVQECSLQSFYGRKQCVCWKELRGVMKGREQPWQYSLLIWYDIQNLIFCNHQAFCEVESSDGSHFVFPTFSQNLKFADFF